MTAGPDQGVNSKHARHPVREDRVRLQVEGQLLRRETLPLPFDCATSVGHRLQNPTLNAAVFDSVFHHWRIIVAIDEEPGETHPHSQTLVPRHCRPLFPFSRLFSVYQERSRPRRLSDTPPYSGRRKSWTTFAGATEKFVRERTSY